VPARQSRTTKPAKTPAGPPSAADFEKLGVLYLGRPYDLKDKQSAGGALLYDSRDLVTHAVCVGMTGSGKTGLCIGLLEEAAIDGIPAIVIDPKGDLTNLLLTFPALRAADFQPWVNPDDARRAAVPLEEYARQQADLWKRGLADWGQDGARIQRLRDAADFVIYTPGSNAGIPVSILSSFAAPPVSTREDAEAFSERVSTTATSLLTLLGVEADPVRSREHILISTILGAAWRAGQDLDLTGLIHAIQTPPVARVGVLDLESFFPSTERFELAMRLNNLLAAPGFELWMQGEPMDVGRFLYTAAGKPRVAIFSIAHLGDAERMSFVSLLLNQVLGWMRGQEGTTSLRAILYMDEIFGFFPPVANPPSKPPLLTLLKQARAFGLGVVLATQNPVDLDYKGLSNTGTWFLGRLQTDRDKARVLDGLEGVAAGTGASFDRSAMDTLLAGLGKRIFLLHNVHEDAPVVFETRWAMSYLRGPVTREGIKRLMDPIKAAQPADTAQPAAASAAAAPAPAPAPVVAPAAPASRDTRGSSTRPVLSPGVSQFFVPIRAGDVQRTPVRYVPMLFGAAQVRFQDAKLGLSESRDVTVLVPFASGAVATDWDHAAEAGVAPADLSTQPVQPATFDELPDAATKAKSYDTWTRDIAGWLLQTQQLELLRTRSGEISRPGETERDFRIRLQGSGREQRDGASDRLRQKYAPKIAALQERLRHAQQTVDREQVEAQQAKVQTAVEFGATILSAFMGRKRLSYSTLSRATSTARGVGRSYKQTTDVARAGENVAALQEQIAELEAQFRAEADAMGGGGDPVSDQLETVVVKPKRLDVSVRAVGLAWVPQ
jgi:hypothetical protein